MSKESTICSFITESRSWWKPVRKAYRNGFVRCKVNYSSCSRSLYVTRGGYRSIVSVSVRVKMNWWQIFRLECLLFYEGNETICFEKKGGTAYSTSLYRAWLRWCFLFFHHNS